MKSFKYLLFLVLIVFIGIAVYVAVQPNSFEVKHTRVIKAPAAVIYDYVLDLKNWETWTATNSKTEGTFTERSKGIGSSYSWVDDDDFTSIISITSATPYKSIGFDIQKEAFPKSEITLDFSANEDGSTSITQVISSSNLSFKFKAISAFNGGVEKQIAATYERNLKELDSLILTGMEKFDIKVNGITQHSGGFYLYNTTSCKMGDFTTKMQDMLAQVGAYAMSNNIRMAGKPFVLYHKWDEDNNTVMFSCCIPTSEKIITIDSANVTGQLEPFTALKTTLTGNYSNLKKAWAKAMAYVPENGLEFAEQGPMLEIYVTDPMTTLNPADWKTEIFIAIK